MNHRWYGVNCPFKFYKTWLIFYCYVTKDKVLNRLFKKKKKKFSTILPRTEALTLLVGNRLFSFAFSFGFSLIRDFAGHGARDVELVDVEGGLTEGWHGGVHACIAIGRTAECSQVQGFATRDDGDVEWKFAAAVGRGWLGDGEWRRRGELAAGTWRCGWLAVEEFTVLTAGKEKLQRATGEERVKEKRKRRHVWKMRGKKNIFHS